MTDINWDEQPTPEHSWLEWKDHGYISGWVLDKKDYYEDRYSRISKALENIDYTIHLKPEAKAFEPVVGDKIEILLGDQYDAFYVLFVGDQMIVVKALNGAELSYSMKGLEMRKAKSDKELFIEKAVNLTELDGSLAVEGFTRMYDAGFKAPSED